MNLSLIFLIYLITNIVYQFSLASSNLKDFYKFSRPIKASHRLFDVPSMSAILKECPSQSTSKSAIGKDQVMVNIRLAPSNNVDISKKYLLLDELYDPKRRCKARLMAPYLIEVKRNEPILMYPLEFFKVLLIYRYPLTL